MNTDPYIIRGGASGADRLEVLAHATWPISEPFLRRAGLQSGMSCLDVGCGNGAISRRLFEIVGPTGTVHGIDRDATTIALAQQYAAHAPAGARATFSVADACTKLNALEPRFDCVYLRLILSHLPDPPELLQHVRYRLNPHGILAIEDVNFDGHYCEPACPAFTRYVELYKATARQRGADPTIGPQLEAMVRAAGYRDIAVSAITPAFTTGPGKQMALLTLDAITASILAAELATAQGLDLLRRELAAFTHDPTTRMSLPTFHQLRCGV